MSQAQKRIQKELKYFNEEDHDENFTAGPDDESDLFKWTATFPGPEGSPYEGGTFSLRIEFPKDFPFKPPKVESNIKVYHPNFKQDTGSICLDILKDQWSPEIKVIDILIAIQNLLINPNCDHPLEKEVAKQYMEDRATFDKTAKEWTEQYAN